MRRHHWNRTQVEQYVLFSRHCIILLCFLMVDAPTDPLLQMPILTAHAVDILRSVVKICLSNSALTGRAGRGNMTAAADMRPTSERPSTELVDTTQIERYNDRTYFPRRRSMPDRSVRIAFVGCMCCVVPVHDLHKPDSPSVTALRFKGDMIFFTLKHLEYHEM